MASDLGPFNVGYPVDFRTGGDTTRDAFGKHIQEIMRTGKHEKLPQKYLTIVEECLSAYVDKVYNILLEHGYNLEVTEIVFVGGGANVVKRFGNYDGNNIQYIEDVKANAKGYEYRSSSSTSNKQW